MLQKIKFSQSDLEISPLALGMWNIHKIEQVQLNQLMEAAIEAKVTTIDHADIYGGYICEAIFGQWLKNQPHTREQLQLVSKCGIQLTTENRPANRVKHYDTSYAHIQQSVNNSLKNLNTDYLDLLLIHRPDPLMEPDEVARAFSDLKQSGKVRYFGVSNFTPRQFELLQAAFDHKLVTNQIEISIFHAQPMLDGTLDYFNKIKVQPMAWSPLGGTNNINSILTNERINALAKQNGLNVGDLLLAWLLTHPAKIVPVLGTMNPLRVKSAAKAFGTQLEKQDWFELLEIVSGKRVP